MISNWLWMSSTSTLVGTFSDPATQGNVLNQYIGKGITTFGNSSSYFQNGNRTAFGLPDPVARCQLAKEQVFSFADLARKMEGADKWESQGIFLLFISYGTQAGHPGY